MPPPRFRQGGLWSPITLIVVLLLCVFVTEITTKTTSNTKTTASAKKKSTSAVAPSRDLLDQPPLNVFIIPHSHCDPGWLQTFDSYHSRYVNKILTNVVTALKQDPKRRFVWAEISFFSRWYDKASQEMRDLVKRLISTGQLEFVEGGWVQPDEASTNLDNAVEQLTEGHEYLMKMFGVRPRIGWQIDPFGHSALTPTLFSLAGFDAMVINRIHHNLKSYFKQTRHMEFVWRGSKSMKSKSEIFTHVLHTHYSAPQRFDFEEGGEAITTTNVESRSKSLMRELRKRSRAYRTNNLLVMFGDDFKFVRADTQFTNMDKLIDWINRNREYNINIQYSTASEYFDTVRASNTKFPLYQGDFFPYADNEDSYWTGYYTTRPALKGLIRSSTAILRAAESAYVFGRAEAKHHEAVKGDSLIPWSDMYTNILQSRRDVALTHHHDGITGTAKQHVAEDYVKRLEKATNTAQWVLGEMATMLLGKNNKNEEKTQLSVWSTASDSNLDVTPSLVMKPGKERVLVVYNSLGWTSRQYVTVKVQTDDWNQLVVLDAQMLTETEDEEQAIIRAQVTPVIPPNSHVVSAREFYLHFIVQVPPVGYATYLIRQLRQVTQPSYVDGFTHSVYVTSGQGLPPGNNAPELLPNTPELKITLENEYLRLKLSSKTGLPHSVVNLASQQEARLDFSFLEYNTRRSGAYIFRTDGGSADTVPHHTTRVHMVKGPLVSKAVIQIGAARPGFSLVVYLYNEGLGEEDIGNVLHFGYMVDAAANREVVGRFSTDLRTGGGLYLDNGYEMRARGTETPRSHITSQMEGRAETQFYPCVSMATIRDQGISTTPRQLTLLSQRAMGMRGHRDGELEFMMHRHLSKDDGRGMGEGVRETAVVGLNQWVLFDTVQNAESLRRKLSLRLNTPMVLLKEREGDGLEIGAWTNAFRRATYSPLRQDLPPNVHLFSFRGRDAISDEVVLRLAHIYEPEAKSENAPLGQLSRRQELRLSDVFAGADSDVQSLVERWVVESPRERSLSLTWNADELANRVRYDSSLGELKMDIDMRALDGDVQVSQNTKERGVFISNAALELEEEAKLRDLERQRPQNRKLMAMSMWKGSPLDLMISLEPLDLKSYVLLLSKNEPAAEEVKQDRVDPEEKRRPLEELYDELPSEREENVAPPEIRTEREDEGKAQELYEEELRQRREEEEKARELYEEEMQRRELDEEERQKRELYEEERQKREYEEKIRGLNEEEERRRQEVAEEERRIREAKRRRLEKEEPPELREDKPVIQLADLVEEEPMPGPVRTNSNSQNTKSPVDPLNPSSNDNFLPGLEKERITLVLLSLLSLVILVIAFLQIQKRRSFYSGNVIDLESGRLRRGHKSNGWKLV